MNGFTPLVEYRAVQKRYASSTQSAVEGLDLVIGQGEFLSLLGPSGSGKTTALMMLAGFEAPTSGDVYLKGRSLAGVPPHKRNIGIVFQNYALFPHMTVAQNLAFPLRVRGMRGTAVTRKIEDALTLVQLEGLADRRPGTLSGGQRQRVALARALIFDPEIVLMDEPLGALDRQLRERLQEEIKRIQRALNLTVVYVTHDQNEALTLSDRIAVFAEGRVQQLGTPRDIYERPANAFVAGFVGDNNRLRGRAGKTGTGICEIALANGHTISATPVGCLFAGQDVSVTVRPEHIEISAVRAADAMLSGTVEDIVYYGDHARIRARVASGDMMTIRAPLNAAIKRSDTVLLRWSAERCFAFPETLPADQSRCRSAPIQG